MGESLAAAGVHVDVCYDVYRGLARLCRSGGSTRVVVVCVDGLGRSELEFFSVASRTCRSVDLYAYGDQSPASWLAEVTQLEGVRPVTDELIRTLGEKGVPGRQRDSTAGPTEAAVRKPDGPACGSVAEFAPAAPEPVAPPEHGPTAPAERSGTPRPGTPDPSTEDREVAARPQRPAADDEESVASTPGEVPTPGDAVTGGPVRVPWLRYTETPQRRPPPRPAPSSDGGATREPMSRPLPASEPLLTEAELQALMGDDIAAIVPEAPEATGPSDDPAVGDRS